MEQQRSNTPAGGQLTCSTLSLMVPTLRLMSAFAWQVVQHCNLMHYGKVEELVQLVTEVVPDLLSLREKVDLLLGLRAMPATRGPVSATDLQTLVWEFISRLDKLLPLPDIKQTAELLGAAPSLLEECGQLEFEPAQLKTLLDHHTQQDNAIDCTLLGAAPSLLEECGPLEFEPAQLKTLLDHHTQQDNAIECSLAQSLGIIPSTASSPQSKAQQDCSNRKTRSGRKLEPDGTEEDKDGQSDHTYTIEEEDDAMGNQSDEEWLPFPPENCSPTRDEPDPSALMTQAEPSSPHAQVDTAVSSMTWWTCNFTRKKKKTSYMARHFGDTLCELVRNHPHLYDEASPLRKTHVFTTWNDISRALKLDQKECRLKWKAIRDRFVKANKKDPEKRSRHDLANIQRLLWLEPYLKKNQPYVPKYDMAAELPSAQAEPSSHAEVATATAVSKNRKKWTKKTYSVMGQGFLETLCELVRNHPNLYDATSPLHTTQYSYTTWNDVGRALQLSGEECRWKWKYIRDRFVKAIKKDPEQRSGRDLSLVQRLSWLIPHLQLYRPRVTNGFMAPEKPSATPSLLDKVIISNHNSMTESLTSRFKQKKGKSCIMGPGFSDSLCELVRKQPHLHDTASPLHTAQHCHKTWKDIGRAFNLSGEECRRKWKAIRDHFVRVSRKQKKNGRDLETLQRLAWLKPYLKTKMCQSFAVTNDPKDDMAPELPSAKPSLLESVVSSWVQSQRTNPSTASSPQSQSENPIIKYSVNQFPELQGRKVVVCLERLPQSKPQQDCSDIKKWTRSGSTLLPQGAEEDDNRDGQSDHSVEEEDGAEGKQRDEEWLPENCSPSTQVEPDTAAWITQPEPAAGSSTQAPEHAAALAALMSQTEPLHSEVATAGGSSTQAPEPAALMSQPEPSSRSQVATAVFKEDKSRKFEDGSWPGCELIRNCPHLYDGSAPLYDVMEPLHRQKCRDSWDEIARTLKLSVYRCRKRWRQIRLRFRSAHRKVPLKQSASDLAMIRHLDWLKPYIDHLIGRNTHKTRTTEEDDVTTAEPDDPAAVTTQPEPSSPATAGGKKSHVTARRRPIDRCSFCGLTGFSRHADLIRHIGTHTLPFSCGQCDKRYPFKASLTNHMLTHKDERPFKCEYCGRGFNLKNTLVTHVRTHTREQCYTCHICGKTSVQNHTHKRHMLTHEGEKKYLCTECGKVFANTGELVRHTRGHTGERPYPCKLCGKRFAVSSSRAVHMRSHTGEKPYSCIHCPKAFATSNARTRHMWTHFDKKPFECSKCAKGFAERYLRNTHIKSGKCKK